MLFKFLELCQAGAARRGDPDLGIVDGLHVVVTLAAVPGAQPAQVVICFLVKLEKPRVGGCNVMIRSEAGSLDTGLDI